MSSENIYFFRFGYLHPEDWLSSLTDRDFEYESSALVPVNAVGKHEAMQQGCAFAMWYVEKLFGCYPQVLVDAKEVLGLQGQEVPSSSYSWSTASFGCRVEEEISEASQELASLLPTLQADAMPDFAKVREALQD
ncbi:MAG: hypothetical protein AAF802_24620 [Planctomycetota bacterium]